MIGQLADKVLPWETIFLVAILILTLYLLTRKKHRPGRRRRKASVKTQWRRKASQRWLTSFRRNEADYSKQQRFAYLRKVDAFLWEEILMKCFEERGYPIIRTKMTRDGGSDGFVKIEGSISVIQAKRYSNHVRQSHVDDLRHLVERDHRISSGILIHTGKTSKQLKQYIRKIPEIELISGVDRIFAFLEGKPLIVLGKPLKGIGERVG